MGHKTLDYCLNICAGKLDYLVRIPNKILVKIIFYLNLEDVINLGTTSRHFNEVIVLSLPFELLFFQRFVIAIHYGVRSMLTQH